MIKTRFVVHKVTTRTTLYHIDATIVEPAAFPVKLVHSSRLFEQKKTLTRTKTCFENQHLFAVLSRWVAFFVSFFQTPGLPLGMQLKYSLRI